MSRLIITTLVAASIAACVGQREITDDQQCPCAPGWACDEARDVCIPSSIDAGTGSDGPAAPAAFSSAEVQAALAQCDLPHGPALSPATYGEKRALMLGAWIDCPPAPDTVYSPALVFMADGTWQRYLSDGNGGLMLAYGVQNQGRYSFPFSDISSTNGDATVAVAVASGDSSPTGFGDGPMTLEASPSRMHAIINYIDQTLEIWLVTLPAE